MTNLSESEFEKEAAKSMKGLKIMRIKYVVGPDEKAEQETKKKRKQIHADRHASAYVLKKLGTPR